ncbi:MAG: SAM-dependent methyltransferase, partial [Mycobacterium sp.]
WEIDEIRPAFIHSKVPQVPEVTVAMPLHDRDDRGRMKMPAYLLSAHKAG